MTSAFGAIVLLDLRLYGTLPDPSLLPLQLLLVGTTAVAATRRRWAGDRRTAAQVPQAVRGTR